ncbi:HTH-type transcriptional regulator, lysR family (plasmid) [Phaeobacter inhibens]|uniref:HTH-type transcriptional regulator, lysR family n=1 Tax=Phaeobacter inhibens TaxID=221822 RepID=A0ABM6RKH6_9RHOB|nr:LysR family transcriptional regulator [Phaeobacter inhibens]AUQ52459.1 HTH-type transcriptional regulator, lysR family [Phaeobacter inhibens]AUQ97064.1 HTH-type transcriptional regulator, lysR family [Phaeobacter inhibens]AUR22264.1 HTH-type transcriptional regulator, lysR family [Phaeobacter inhibens]
MRHRSPFSGNLSDVDVSLLREFLEIVSAGGITAAEARLNKSKSAISIGLSKLEQRLGVRLCERGRSGFALTEQGRLIHTATEQLMSEINRFSDFVGSASHRLEGEISVMIDDSFVFEMEQPIAATIAKMNENYPELNLKVRMTAPDRVLESVLEGNADLGFTALIQTSDALDLTPLFEEEMGLFCGADHPLFDVPGSELSYELLQRHSFVRTDVTQNEDFRAFLSGLSFLASAPTILSRMLLILSSRYLGFVPLRFAEFWVHKGSIREIRVPGSRVKNGCYLVHRKSRPLGMAAGIFKDTLIKEVEKHIAGLSK